MCTAEEFPDVPHGITRMPALHARPGLHLGETPEHGRAACRHVRQHFVLVMRQEQVEVCVRLLAAAPENSDPLSCWPDPICRPIACMFDPQQGTSRISCLTQTYSPILPVS